MKTTDVMVGTTEPFNFFNSPWWKDMSEKLCSDGWPSVVVALNCFVRDAKQSYELLRSELYIAKYIINEVKREAGRQGCACPDEDNPTMCSGCRIRYALSLRPK